MGSLFPSIIHSFKKKLYNRPKYNTLISKSTNTISNRLIIFSVEELLGLLSSSIIVWKNETSRHFTMNGFFLISNCSLSFKKGGICAVIGFGNELSLRRPLLIRAVWLTSTIFQKNEAMFNKSTVLSFLPKFYFKTMTRFCCTADGFFLP